MAGYQELIKNFDKLRDYMRDLFVYGYRTRNDFKQKSSRTYDNERRRVENYLSKYIKWDYGKTGKRVFVSVDAAKITCNPFYQAYRCKSFTNNDLLLHFYLLDILADGSSMKVEEVTELIWQKYDKEFEVQTVRAKLNEYVKEGLLVSSKMGRAFSYAISQDNFANTLAEIKNLQPMLDFFSEAAPFGVIGHYLKNRCPENKEDFVFKHHFIMHTLDDNILLTLLQAMHEKRQVKVTNFALRYERISKAEGLPLKILVSTQTGRRYVVMAINKSNKMAIFRLDHIKAVKLEDIHDAYEAWQNKAESRLSYCWGSTIKASAHKDDFEMVLYINEESEQYILHRLEREKRHGQVEKIETNYFRYSIKTSNASELMGWVKSFTGRIVSVSSTNAYVKTFYKDMQRMQEMYGGTD